MANDKIEMNENLDENKLLMTKKMVNCQNQLVRKQNIHRFTGLNRQEMQNQVMNMSFSTYTRVKRVTRWALNLTFGQICLPLLLVMFLTFLHGHREIQIGVMTGVLVFSFVFFITTRDRRRKKNNKKTCNNKQALLPEPDQLKEETTPSDQLMVDITKTKICTEDATNEEKLKICISSSAILLLYHQLPLNRISQLWGSLSSTRLPYPLDKLSVWLFVTITGCDRSEAELDLSKYKTVSDFFTRKLRSGVRNIFDKSELVSPSDGLLTFSGVVEGPLLEQIKGVHYSLAEFLGCLHTINSEDVLDKNIDKYQHMSGSPSFLQHNPTSSHCLYQIVVYLRPSDYHHFHSPTDWTLIKRRHFPGKLFSVKPNIVRNIPGLFHINERVAFIGKWNHGFFAMVAIGATNVGSIVAHHDPHLSTNSTSNMCLDEKLYNKPINFKKGDEFGYFKFGSTIVLIFEAPIDLKSRLSQSVLSQIYMGQSLLQPN